MAAIVFPLSLVSRLLHPKSLRVPQQISPYPIWFPAARVQAVEELSRISRSDSLRDTNSRSGECSEEFRRKC